MQAEDKTAHIVIEELGVRGITRQLALGRLWGVGAERLGVCEGWGLLKCDPGQFQNSDSGEGGVRMDERLVQHRERGDDKDVRESKKMSEN